jgi:hypothetical protein
MIKSRMKLLFVLLVAMIIPSILRAQCHGKIDVGASLISVDVLESGKTEETLHMNAIKADAILLVTKGLAIKPGMIWGRGDGSLFVGSLGVGHFWPIHDRIMLLPTIGVAYSQLHTHIDLEDIGLFHLKEKFHSTSVFVALEFSFRITEKWSLIGMAQYAWSRTHTTIDPIVSSKGNSNGPNYNLGIEYSFNKNWAINAGVGYNISLSREKHGLRAKGAKIGAVYYF